MREKVVAGVVVGGPVCRRNAALMEGGGAQCCHKKRGNHFTEPCVRGTAVRKDRIPPEERLYFCWHAHPRNICDAPEVSAESHENKLRRVELLHFPGNQR